MPPTPDFVFFDLGNVLLRFDHERGFRQMAELLGAEAALLRSFFAAEGRQFAYERGEVTSEQLFDELLLRTDATPDAAALLLAGGDIFEPIEEMVALLEELHDAGVQLGLLSNTCDCHWRVCLDGRFPFLQQRFQCHVLSFVERAAKPEPAIYRRAAELAGVPPQRILFIDDLPANVAGAQQAGFEAVLFTDAVALRDDLRRRGLPVA